MTPVDLTCLSSGWIYWGMRWGGVAPGALTPGSLPRSRCSSCGMPSCWWPCSWARASWCRLSGRHPGRAGGSLEARWEPALGGGPWEGGPCPQCWELCCLSPPPQGGATQAPGGAEAGIPQDPEVPAGPGSAEPPGAWC